MVTGGEVLVKSLVENGVKTVYGLPGSHILDIYDALRSESRINHISVLHEVNAAIMADAQGRLTGKPGVCLVTAGPGATNTVTGIAQAYSEASPVVQITGHCESNRRIQPFHGVDDWEFLMKIFQPITKWCVQVTRVEDIPQAVSKAFKIATSGRPGPVHVEIPRDILSSSSEVKVFKIALKEASLDSTPSVKRIAKVLNDASNPVIAVGRGVLREFCSKEVMTLAETIGAPILTLPYGINAIPYQCPLYVGYELRRNIHPNIQSLIEEADVILTLGLDVGERLTYFTQTNSQRIHIHHDPSHSAHDKVRDVKGQSILDVEVRLRDFLSSLMKEVNSNEARVDLTTRRVEKIKREIRNDVANSIERGRTPLHPGELITKLSDLLDEDAIVAIDIGRASAWTRLCHRPQTPNTILTPGRYGSMGFPLPAAIAAKINFPERQVVGIVGDGAFLMSYMDFSTAVKNNLKIVIIVTTDHQWGTIWLLQRRRYQGRTFATDIKVPNFAEYARSFGATGINIKGPQDLTRGLMEALNAKSPVLVQVETNYKVPFYTPRSG
jgi:acetolactate synthase-1/2/3 large subunit